MKRLFGKRSYLLLLLTCLLQQMVSAATYTVTNTNNSGAGSLRQAIDDANANPGADIIQFAIPDLGAAGQYFEGGAVLSGTRYAVIRVSTALPTITGPVLIDGYTQANSNTGAISGRVVGVDNVTQPDIPHPDVYIVPASGFTFPTASTSIAGNGFSINSPDVTIRGLAISGFGINSSDSQTASGNADISILRSSTARTVNINIYDCFFSCDPRGNYPTLTERRTRGNSILICGFNYSGHIYSNYINSPGTYGIHFNGITDNLNVGPSSSGNAHVIQNENWTIEYNQLLNIGTITTATSNRVSDAVNLMKCISFNVRYNYIDNVQQVGVDMGYNAEYITVLNNTITGFTATNGIAPHCGMRVGLHSRNHTIQKNIIFNNNGTNFEAGIWLDESTISRTGITTYASGNTLIEQNHIFNNNRNGISLSNSGNGTTVNNIITQNLIYDNTGLAIDINIGSAGSSIFVSTNDDGDGDNGPNNRMNFPVIDSVKKTPIRFIIYGKSAPGAYLEFFFTDGGTNQHGGRLFNYGEAEYFIGSGTEGSVDDLRTTTGLSYNTDGNVASSNVNGFTFSFPMVSLPVGIAPFVTATATVSNNTSEMGPMLNSAMILAGEVLTFTGKKRNNAVELMWEVSTTPSIRFFEIEYSGDGSQFSSSGIVQYNTASEQPIQNYSKLMTNVIPGTNYYRLRTVYNDGTSYYSKTAMFNFSGIAASVKAGPNPFTNKINIEFQETSNRAEYQIRLLDVSGKLVNSTTYKSSIGLNRFTWNLTHLNDNNVYIVEMISETGDKFQQKLIHQ